MALSEVEDGSQRVVLYYTDPGTRGRTQEAASFKMGDLTGRWARFTLTVQGAEVGGHQTRCVRDPPAVLTSAGLWPLWKLKWFCGVVVTQVRLYMDCEEYHRVAFNRSPRPLTFEAGSGIFVGNAGGTGLTKFVVSWLLPILVFLMTSGFLVLARPDLRPLKCLIPAVTR